MTLTCRYQSVNKSMGYGLPPPSYDAIIGGSSEHVFMLVFLIQILSSMIHPPNLAVRFASTLGLSPRNNPVFGAAF